MKFKERKRYNGFSLVTYSQTQLHLVHHNYFRTLEYILILSTSVFYSKRGGVYLYGKCQYIYSKPPPTPQKIN